MKIANLSLLCIAGSLLVCASAAAQQAGVTSDSQPVGEGATRYRNWLTEDVAYIITDAERAGFLGYVSTGN